MKEKKSIIIAVVILLLAIVATVGASYAYFATVNKTSGNDKKLNIITEDLGSIKWEGTKVYTSDNLLPGECGVQTFTIEKNSPTGKEVYEIDLKGVIDEVFGSDVEITLYKSIDTTKDNIIDAVWNKGSNGTNYYTSESGGLTKNFYTYERSDDTGKICTSSDFCNDTVEKTTTWKGLVGLAYASDLVMLQVAQYKRPNNMFK